MLLYIIILFVILSLLVYEQNRSTIYSPQSRGLGAFFVVFALGLIAGLRDMMGGYDVDVYANIFENLAKNQKFSLGLFFSLGSEGRAFGLSEPGWTLYNRIVGVFTDSKYTFFLITALISYLSLFRHLRKYAPYFFFALLIIFCRQFLQSFIYVRQFMACMIVWFALDFAIKRKLIPFLFIIWVSMNIHVSGLIFIIVYPLARVKLPVWLMLGGFATAVTLGLTPAFGGLLESFGESVGNEKALGYADGTGGGVHLFYTVEGILMAVALLMSRSSIYELRPSSSGNNFFTNLKRHIPRVEIESSKRMICLFNVSFLYVCASLTTLQSPGMMRLIWVYWIGPICMLPLVCEKMIAGNGSKTFFKYLIILYFITAFWLFATRFNSGEMMNYSTFIFSKN